MVRRYHGPLICPMGLAVTDSTRTTLSDCFDQAVFDAICSRALVYNTCWEDPAVDRQVLGIGPDDRMPVITSAGCNVLDYALLGPERIHAVDCSWSATSWISGR